ncbi:hypothetical protein AURDEDRAFT_149798 [Auricularia subglabra TFB-10046 SS5]|nr:hypothetical protein AURDEDRAFT_149798 [Auricularia subglabra TFB-10046 SS5]
MPTRRAFVDLPQELVDLVVDVLYADADFPTLLACNSTGHRLRSRARAHIYHSMVVSATPAAEAASGHLRLSFADFVAAHTWAAWRLVKHLEIVISVLQDAMWPELIDALNHPSCQMTSLENLVLIGEADDVPAHMLCPYIRALQRCCASTVYLDLEHGCECRISLLVHLVAGFPALQHVVMPSHIIPESSTMPVPIDSLQSPKSLRTVSLSVTGCRDLRLVNTFTNLLRREGVGRILFVDSFFLPDIISTLSNVPKDIRETVQAVVSDTKWENCGLVQLFDAYPSLRFLCISVQLDASYFNLGRPQRCTLIGLCIHLVRTIASRPAELRYLAMAISVPASMALRTMDYMCIEDLCKALSAPYARHLRLIIIFLLEAGKEGASTADSEDGLTRMEHDLKQALAQRLSRLDATSGSKRWMCIIERDDGKGDRDWRDMRGPPMQKLMAKCISGTFVI